MTNLKRFSVHANTVPPDASGPTTTEIKVVEAADPIAAATLSRFPLDSIVLVRRQDYAPVVAWSYER